MAEKPGFLSNKKAVDEQRRVTVGNSGKRLKHRKSVGGLLKKLTGILFVGLGIKLALSHVE